MKSLPEVIFQQGFKDSPLCLFIHGLAMDKNIWAEPEKTRILAGNFPIAVLLSEPPSPIKGGLPDIKPSITSRITTGLPPAELRTSFHDLREEGYSVMAYSQRRPASDCMSLVRELYLLLKHYHQVTKNGIILIGHSRGGLIARKAIELLNIRSIALITLSSPHHGSRLAKLAGLLSGFSRVLYPFFENAEMGTVRGILKRVTEFLKSEAITELLPQSPFIKSLDNKRLKSVKNISIGGTDPTLFTLYRWRKDCSKYEKMFSIPEILTSFLPEGVMPEELVMGKGDGLVSARSSKAPYAFEHKNFPLNHARILFDPSVRKSVTAFVRLVS